MGRKREFARFHARADFSAGLKASTCCDAGTVRVFRTCSPAPASLAPRQRRTRVCTRTGIRAPLKRALPRGRAACFTPRMSEAKIDPETLPYRPCVGLMVLNRDGKVFVGKRIDQSIESWQMPQGGIDPGEQPRETALRELGEEIGTTKVEFIREHPGWLTYDLPP